MWTKHDNFKQVVDEEWNDSDLDIVSKLSNLCGKLYE